MTSMKVLVVVEDDPDVQFLIETIFSMDSRFSVAEVAASAEEALEMARTTGPGLIVLDQGLAGRLTGIEAAPRFKEVAPLARITLSSQPMPNCVPLQPTSPPLTRSCSRPTQRSC